MLDRITILFGKQVYWISQVFGLGVGGTWPGEIATRISPNILAELFKSLDKGIIIVAGTNGKTTTSLMIKKILEKAGNKIVHNSSGANLVNGVVSSFVQEADWMGKIKADWGVFEVDENSFPLVIRMLSFNSSREDGDRIEKNSTGSSRLRSNNKKVIVVLLNLFRDQLDRYGEVDVIVEKWGKALKQLPENSTLILNADDPGVAWLGKNYSSREAEDRIEKFSMVSSRLRSNNKTIYFGLNDPKLFLTIHEHATDSAFCLNCGSRLNYSGIFYSHLGHWKCPKCTNSRMNPDIFEWPPTLPGLYNQYNTLAAVSVVKSINIGDKLIKSALKDFHPAFGRQEEFEVDGKQIKIFLSKNPAGFNASLRTVLELKPKVILLALNDRIPDGRDVSWIWDVDFETIPENVQVIVSGERSYDMVLRIKYSVKFEIRNSKFESNPKMKIQNLKQLIVESNLPKAIQTGLKRTDKGEVLYILPTYSAMLEVRKIISGRKIM